MNDLFRQAATGGDTFLGQGPSATLYGANYFLDLEGYYAVTLFGASGAINRMHTNGLNYLFPAIPAIPTIPL